MANQPTPKDPPISTNALLSQILDTDKKILAVVLAANVILQQSLTTAAASLKVQTESRDYLKQLSNAIIGGDGHTFTVRVQQIADKIASHVASKLAKH